MASHAELDSASHPLIENQKLYYKTLNQVQGDYNNMILRRQSFKFYP